MKKNVAGQKVGAQMITASDGSVFTGSVTVYVTGDAGTQAVGSVGAGACTHEGNGYHTYAPAQAETSYDLIAFTFVGTGAVAATVQVYPSFPQTVDLSTGITAGTITTVTNLTNLPAITTGWLTATGIAAAALNGKGDWNIGKTGYALTATTGLGNQTSNITGTITTVTNLTNAPTSGDLTATMKTSVENAVWDATMASHVMAGTTGNKLNAAASAGDPWTTAVPGAYAAGSAGYILGNNLNAAVGSVPTATQNADALLNRDMSAVSDTNARSPLNALRHIRNKWDTTSVPGYVVVRKEDDTTEAWRAALATDAAAVPITGSDPA